jgi:hypothetical protein
MVMDDKRIVVDRYPKDQKRFSDQLDIAKHTVDTHIPIARNELTSDYVMAHLDERDKEFIIEMYDIANLIRSMSYDLISDYYIGYSIVENYKKMGGHAKDKLGEDMVPTMKDLQDHADYEYCLKRVKEIMNMFMAKMNAIAVMNRNTKQNILLQWILKQLDEEGKEGEPVGPEADGAINKLMSVFKREKGNGSV